MSMGKVTRKNAALLRKAYEIARQEGFEAGLVLHSGYYYTHENQRSVTIAGRLGQKKAVLKVYDDERVVRAARGLKLFAKFNSSQFIRSPRVLKFKEETACSGWTIMTRVPDGAEAIRPNGLTTPLSKIERRRFLEYYVEYRVNFQSAVPELRDAEHLQRMPADVFHTVRLCRWFDLANKAEATRVSQRQERLLDPKKFPKLFTRGLEFVTKHTSTKTPVFCHGLFIPSNLFVFADETHEDVWMTGFDHIGPRPIGYELGLMIWADVFMTMSATTRLTSVITQLDGWLDEYLIYGENMRLRHSGCFTDDPLILRAALVERCMGALMADVVASDMERGRQLNMVRNLTELIEILLEPVRANRIPGLEL
jgi:hypothetical protein